MKKEMLTTLIGAIATMSFAAQTGIEGTAEHIKLGGLRQVHVTISKHEESVDLNVSFIPVAGFDSATNDRINKQKGRTYALEALARYLGGDRASVVVSGMTVLGVQQTGGKWDGHYKVSKAYIAETTPRPIADSGRITSPLESKSANLLTRKGDYLDTIYALTEQDIHFSPDIHGEELDLAIAETESSIMLAFDSITADIKKDVLLLDIEKNELIGEIRRVREQFIRRLSEFAQGEAPHAP